MARCESDVRKQDLSDVPSATAQITMRSMGSGIKLHSTKIVA